MGSPTHTYGGRTGGLPPRLSPTSSSIGGERANPSISLGRVLLSQHERLAKGTLFPASSSLFLSFLPTAVLKTLGFGVIMPSASSGSFLEQSTTNSASLSNLTEVGF